MNEGVYRRRLARIAERCYRETRGLEPGSVPESDALWTAAEEMMQLVATHRGEEWKTVKEREESRPKTGRACWVRSVEIPEVPDDS